MARPYTHAFIRTSVSGSAVRYYVPAGFRAVVTCVAASNVAGVAGEAHVVIAGVYLVVARVQASGVLAPLMMRAVGYAGDNIDVWNTVSGIHTQVSGYLFEEFGAAEQRPYETVEELPLGESDFAGAVSGDRELLA